MKPSEACCLYCSHFDWDKCSCSLRDEHIDSPGKFVCEQYKHRTGPISDDGDENAFNDTNLATVYRKVCDEIRHLWWSNEQLKEYDGDAIFLAHQAVNMAKIEVLELVRDWIEEADE